MGYLFCGPVGTGKTFLAECYAGSIGIPCLKLRNFRSKYVGETEGNLEQVLTVLRSLGPVVVIVDEADAALGNRQADGDSGTSGRVFSMIASQMGDTRYRGQIIWMLLTSRPDLLPIDLKRQGRGEVHIPLFPPHDAAEIARDVSRRWRRRTRCTLADDAIPAVSPARQLSGADLESIVLAATAQGAARRPRAGRARRPAKRRSPSSSPRPRGWKRNCRNWPRCSNARSGASCRRRGARRIATARARASAAAGAAGAPSGSCSKS